MKLIDVDALSDKVDEHCKRHRITAYERDLIQHYLDEEMAPGVEAVPLKPLAVWLAGYASPPVGINAHKAVEPDFFGIRAGVWEEFLRGKDWWADE